MSSLKPVDWIISLDSNSRQHSGRPNWETPRESIRVKHLTHMHTHTHNPNSFHDYRFHLRWWDVKSHKACTEMAKCGFCPVRSVDTSVTLGPNSQRRYSHKLKSLCTGCIGVRPASHCQDVLNAKHAKTGLPAHSDIDQSEMLLNVSRRLALLVQKSNNSCSCGVYRIHFRKKL